jgi:hypothetical protein
LIGLYSVLAAVASAVLSPLLAMSYFATEGGESELEVGTVEAWADPGRDLAGGLLTFASAETVYFTYLKSLMLIVPALVLCAWAVKSRRPEPRSRAERWGWRIALAGYVLLSLGVILALPWDLALNIAFFALIVPGLLLGTIGSTVLGIALLRASYRPRLTPWLLSFSIPLWLVASDGLGHNSIGLIPLFVAWAATGWRLWRGEPRERVPAEGRAARSP